MTLPTLTRILSSSALSLAALGLSSCCFDSPLTCNLRELASPPDARVAMVDHMFPCRYYQTSDGFWVLIPTGTWGDSDEPYLYQLNGIHYRKRTIQYARAHRPVIRRADRADVFSYPLMDTQLREQFTIDSSIPEEVWMQPVNVTDKDMEFNQLVCIPAKQFDFARARKMASPIPSPRPLCDLPIKDKPGTSSLWRNVLGAPLAVVDMAATATLCVAEGAVVIGAAIILLPGYPFFIYAEQQQQIPFHIDDDELPAWKSK